MKLNDKVYDCLKWICLIGLPAASVLYTGIAKIWGAPYAAEVTQTLAIIGTFIGSMIGISTASYNKDE